MLVSISQSPKTLPHLFGFEPQPATPFVLLDLEVGLERSDSEFPFLEQLWASIRRAIVAFWWVAGQPAIGLLPILVLQALRQVLAFLQRPKLVERPPIVPNYAIFQFPLSRLLLLPPILLHF